MQLHVELMLCVQVWRRLQLVSFWCFFFAAEVVKAESALSVGTFVIQQSSNRRYLDALGVSLGYGAVTRLEERNDSQEWLITPTDSGAYTIQQKVNMLFLDCQEGETHDFPVAMRSALYGPSLEPNACQEWIIARLSSGAYTIQHKESMRYLDAYEDRFHDYAVVTRPEQGDDSQTWIFTAVPIFTAGTFTIQQRSSMLYLDAREWNGTGRDHRVVTWTGQDDGSQEWVLSPLSNGAYTIQQKDNQRYLDAYSNSKHNYRAVTSRQRTHDSQEWVVTLMAKGAYAIRQKSSMRFLDACVDHPHSAYSVVTRLEQHDHSQAWMIKASLPIVHSGTYTIRQKANLRFLDSYDDSWVVVTWPDPRASQQWIIQPLSNGAYRLRQKTNQRYLDAHQHSSNSYAAVTRPKTQSDSQEWIITSMNTRYATREYTIQQKVNRRYLDADRRSVHGLTVFTSPKHSRGSLIWVIQPSVDDVVGKYIPFDNVGFPKGSSFQIVDFYLASFVALVLAVLVYCVSQHSASRWSLSLCHSAAPGSGQSSDDEHISLIAMPLE